MRILTMLFFLTLAFQPFFLVAQCDTETNVDLNNPGMEDWVNEGNYEDPAGSFWDTANRTVDLAPFLINPNVTKSTDAHSGTYSAKLETSSWFGLTSSATVFSGEFDPDEGNPLESIKFGKPFTETPDYFRGWYKYEPVSGDSAEIYTYLHRWDGSERVRVAEAYTKVYDATSGWEQFNIEFEYLSSDMPDSITMVFASSAGGAEFQGRVGNTLYIDDVELYYCTVTSGFSTPLMSELDVNTFPNPADGMLRFDLDDHVNGSIRIFSMDGREMGEYRVNGDTFTISLDRYSDGLYKYVILDDSSTALASGSFMKKRD